MHIISIKMLREFWQKHPEAEGVLREWHSVVEHAEFSDFNHVRSMFNSADYVPPYRSLMWVETTTAWLSSSGIGSRRYLCIR
jgi:mRNA-degrading endonuclease HigB of HigAB toxin-antitoxin module